MNHPIVKRYSHLTSEEKAIKILQGHCPLCLAEPASQPSLSMHHPLCNNAPHNTAENYLTQTFGKLGHTE